MDREEGLQTIREIVAEALDLPLDDVHPQSRLFEELGADSLDFVDLLFSFEERFEVKLMDSELDFLTRLDATNPKVQKGGFLTAEALDLVRPVMPALATVEDLAHITPRALFSLVTLETIWLVIERAKAKETKGETDAGE